jgi:hypothetical protein
MTERNAEYYARAYLGTFSQKFPTSERGFTISIFSEDSYCYVLHSKCTNIKAALTEVIGETAKAWEVSDIGTLSVNFIARGDVIFDAFHDLADASDLSLFERNAAKKKRGDAQ